MGKNRGKSPEDAKVLWRLIREADFRFVLLVFLTYSVIVSLCYWAIEMYVAGALKPQFNPEYLSTLAPAFLQFSSALGIYILFAAVFAAAGNPPDRRMLLKAGLVTGTPFLVCFGATWILRLGFWAISDAAYWFLCAGLFLIIALYYQVATPIMRTWIHRNAKSPDRIAMMETYLSWPFKPSEWRDVEIEIPPAKYFSLLGGFGAILFLILEAILGEFLSNSLAVTGYAGAAALAVMVAAMLYPAHAWASKRITIPEPEDAGDVEVSLWREFGQKTWGFYKLLIVRHWLAVLILVAIGAAIGKLLSAFLWPY